MRAKIAIIGPQEVVAGFSLLGVDIIPAHTKSQALECIFRLKKTMQNDGDIERPLYGIVFVSEEFLQGLSADDEAKVSRGAFPAIIPLPSHRGSSTYGVDRLKKLVERAVGSNILQ